MLELIANESGLLFAMGVLLIVSALMSSSEAAYFSLSLTDKGRLASGGLLSRSALALLRDPERLLGTILLGNLIVNLVYFTLSSVVAFHLQHAGQPYLAVGFAVSTLLLVMVFAEMLPKDLAVLAPRSVACAWSMPLTLLVTAMRPITPVLRWATRMSRRLIVPHFEEEATLASEDFHRIVSLAKEDANLKPREHRWLRAIVSLADVTVKELMFPRPYITLWQLPLDRESVVQELRQSMRRDFLFITESTSDDIAATIPVADWLAAPQSSRWTSLAAMEHSGMQPLYIPWSATAASLWEQLRENCRRVAVVVNEYGETIGVVTEDDLWHFFLKPSQQT
ncbi:MAG: CNNM domain-containing protein [Thermoguttaceae bacterium]